VAASLQTPVLFTLAETLARMELLAAVDEADVGRVQVGQPASFAVDAYPGRRFPAEITQVRYAPKTVGGVVTYDTVLIVDNGDLLLRPGMTATVEITVQQLAGQTLVPNAALRFSPDGAAGGQSFSGGGFLVRRPTNAKPPRNGEQHATPQVWTLRDGAPVAIPVRVLATDGLRTAIAPGAAEPGTEVLVDILREAS
jgi:HlyD family secretion protein